VRLAGRLFVQRGMHDLGDLLVADARLASATGPHPTKALQAILAKALAPCLDPRRRHADEGTDRGVGLTVAGPVLDLSAGRSAQARGILTADSILEKVRRGRIMLDAIAS
jgi:hypothetical protein